MIFVIAGDTREALRHIQTNKHTAPFLAAEGSAWIIVNDAAQLEAYHGPRHTAQLVGSWATREDADQLTRAIHQRKFRLEVDLDVDAADAADADDTFDPSD